MKRIATLVGFVALVAAALLAPTGPDAVAAPKKDDVKKLTKIFARAMAADDISTAIEAINRIGEVNNDKAAKALVQIGVSDPTRDEIIDSAKSAMAYINDEKALAALVKLLENVKRSPLGVRVFICEAFDRMEGDPVIEGLVSAVSKDPQLPVRRAAMNAMPNKRDRRIVSALVDLLAKLEKDGGLLWEKCRQTLTDLTGEDHPTPEAWKAFWDGVKETFDFDANRGDKTEAETRERQEVPKFFGSEVMSNRVLFIIDISGSMKMTDPEKPFIPGDDDEAKAAYKKLEMEPIVPPRQRINRAKEELKRVVNGLGEHQRFSCMTFSDAARFWNKTLVPANAANKASAVKWVDTLREGGGTRTDIAFDKAFQMNADVDTMIFLSDGAPMRDPNKVIDDEFMDEILTSVKKENRWRKVTIATLGFDGPGIWHSRWGTRPVTIVNPFDPTQCAALAGFLQRLAAENGGEFSSIQ